MLERDIALNPHCIWNPKDFRALSFLSLRLLLKRVRVHTKRGGETLCEFEEDKKQSALKRALLIPHSLFVFVLFYVLCFIICSSVSLSLVRCCCCRSHLCFWSRGFYRAKKQYSLREEERTKHTHARAYVCTACVREFSSGVFIIALDV